MSRDRKLVVGALAGLAVVAVAVVVMLRWRAGKDRDESARCESGDLDACNKRCSARTRDLEACRKLGALSSGEHAIAALRMLCDRNEASACATLADDIAEADREGARALRRKACELGEMKACARFGDELLGAGDAIEGEKVLQLACDAPNGSADACLRLAGYLEHDAPEKEKKEAHAALANARACQLVGGEGCRRLVVGTSHRSTGGTSEAWYYARACEGLPMTACVEFAKGHRGAVDPERALEACEKGEATACGYAADLIAADRDLPLDYVKQASLLVRACDAGLGPHCVKLANLYQLGHGVPKDEVRAADMAHRACADKAKLTAAGRWTCPAEIRLREGAASVNGRLSEEIIRQIVERAKRRFPECWQGRGLPKTKGEVSVEFVVDRIGKVSAAKATKSKNVDRATTQCILEVIRETTFPVPEGGVIRIDEDFTLEIGDR